METQNEAGDSGTGRRVLGLDARLRPASHVYAGSIPGHRFYWASIAGPNMTVIDDALGSLVDRLDGSITIGEACAGLDPEARARTIAELSVLAQRRILSQESVQSPTTLEASQGTPRALSAWIHLTNRCNIACRYCYIEKSGGDMEDEKLFAHVRRLAESCESRSISQLNLKLAGGEPLIRFRQIERLVEYVKRASLDVEVNLTLLTNGLLVNTRVAEFLAENRIGVAVSLDGVGPVHDSGRVGLRGEGTFAGVMLGIGHLRRVGINPTVMTTMTAANFNGLVDLTALVLGEELRFRFSPERSLGPHAPSLLGVQRELIAVLGDCYDLVESRLPKSDFTLMHSFENVQFRRHVRRACGAGRSFVAVGHDGALAVCGMGLASPSHSTVDGGGEVHGAVAAICPDLSRRVADEYPECSDCVWRGACAGGCPLQTQATHGGYARSSPYCETYRAALPRILRIRALQILRDHQRGAVTVAGGPTTRYG